MQGSNSNSNVQLDHEQVFNKALLMQDIKQHFSRELLTLKIERRFSKAELIQEEEQPLCQKMPGNWIGYVFLNYFVDLPLGNWIYILDIFVKDLKGLSLLISFLKIVFFVQKILDLQILWSIVQVQILRSTRSLSSKLNHIQQSWGVH